MHYPDIRACMPRLCGRAARLMAAALGVFLAGCASSPLDELDDTQPAGSAFEQALFRNYETLAHSLGAADSEEGDDFLSDPLAYFGLGSPAQSPSRMLADAFADKALLAASGRDVAPEPARDAASQTARARLVRTLDAGRDRFAEDAARAQADFDCWMLNASVASQGAAADQCRVSLGNGLARLESELNPPPAPVSLPVAAPAPAPVAAASGDYTVYFDFDSWTLTAEDLSVLTNVINTARAGRQTRITVTGHTDTSGAAGYNQALSLHRANVVVEALVDMGARRAAIKASGVGESDLAVQTPDGVKEARNRRAVIDLLP